MPKKTAGAIAVTFDSVVLSQLERQAKRRYSSVQGATQSYIRDAVLQQLRKDIADEDKQVQSTKKSSATELAEAA